jgi:PAS domain S-box-containing protein
MHNMNHHAATKDQLEYFFELSADLFCIAGFDGYFKRINAAVSQTLGYTKEELYSRPINEFVYSEDKDVTSEVRDGLRKNNPLLNFDNRYVTKSGEIVWLSWTSLPISDDKLVFAIAKNITHKKKLEEERNRLFLNLAKINSNLKQLAYATSHDLRSPVNNLLLLFDMLDTSKINDPETLEFIDLLKLTTESLSQTLNNYINVLIKKDISEEQMEELYLKASLDIVLQSINSLIQNSGATIKVDFTELETIRFNKVYLESIFLNLITNSIKYARPGYLPLISISSKKVNNISQLIIADNGLGFDMEKVKNKIFGLNQKFHNHSDGKGVGLYLVHSYVTNSGGQIVVESKPYEGTKFIISLPN